MHLEEIRILVQSRVNVTSEDANYSCNEVYEVPCGVILHDMRWHPNKLGKLWFTSCLTPK